MVCYVVPTAVAVLGSVLRRKYAWDSLHAQWFTMLFAGGSIFGIIDHLWNGELFLLGGNLASDLLLGFAITTALMAVWAVMVHLDKAKNSATSRA